MASLTSSVKAINAFLKRSRDAFLKHHATRSTEGCPTRRLLHIVMGNEALDLDSIVSSMLLAALYQEHHVVQDKISPDFDAVDFLPLLPIERNCLSLRQEAHHLLTTIGVDLPSLVFLDDVAKPANSVKVCIFHLFRSNLSPRSHTNRSKLQNKDVLLNCQKAKQLRVTITDHNTLGQEFTYLQESLVGIVDHHKDNLEGSREALSQETQIVVPLGSASTLVAERYLQKTPLPSIGSTEFDPRSMIDPVVGHLLISTILVDTTNLDPAMGRTTQRDEDAIKALVAHLDEAGDDYGLRTAEERTAAFKLLNHLKFDLSNLETPDLLRKDYKAWVSGGVKYGISSVTLSLAEWTAKDAKISQAFSQFISANQLALLVVMTSFTDEQGTFRRELTAQSASGQEHVLEHVLASISDKLTLTSSPYPSNIEPTSETCKFFKQDNHKLSRKDVQPAIHEALESMKPRL